MGENIRLYQRPFVWKPVDRRAVDADLLEVRRRATLSERPAWVDDVAQRDLPRGRSIGCADVVTILRIDVRLARTSFIRVAWLALRCSDGLLARWLSFRGTFGSRGGAFIVGIEAECNPKHQRTCSADG